MAEINDQKLNELRKEIDILDNQLLEILEDRFEVVKKVAERKKQAGLPIVDKAREDELIKTKCQKSDLPEEFVTALYRLVIDTAIGMEEEEKNERNTEIKTD